MRGLFVLLVASSAVGCADTCGTPATVDGQVYDVFVNAVTYELVNEERFPGDSSPGNGSVQLTIRWGSGLQGPIEVLMDGQAFGGQGTWFDTECGQFSARWQGEYVAETSIHNFAFAGLFAAYDTSIAGDIQYAESWERGDDVGTYTMDGHLLGEQVGATAP